jgi:hypothetical protein
MPLAVSRSLMGAMISTRAKNLADGPGFADRFSRQKRKSLARTFAGLYARMTRKHPVTRSVLLLSGGETKKPRQACTASGAYRGKTPNPVNSIGCAGRIPNKRSIAQIFRRLSSRLRICLIRRNFTSLTANTAKLHGYGLLTSRISVYSAILRNFTLQFCQQPPAPPPR